MTGDVGWAEVNDPSWDPRFAARHVGVLVRLTGLCPRCHHATSTDFPEVIATVGIRESKSEPITLFCKCGYPHDGHPDGDASCGAYWLTSADL